jgi:hypothetical protein
MEDPYDEAVTDETPRYRAVVWASAGAPGNSLMGASVGSPVSGPWAAVSV